MKNAPLLHTRSRGAPFRLAARLTACASTQPSPPPYTGVISAQGAGRDLPMKDLAWEDAAGQTWLTDDEPVRRVRCHGGADCPATGNAAKAMAGPAAATLAA